MLTKVLITVKTYPTLSDKYGELVCTAGFKEDGNWIRIYPIPFRKLDYDKRYKKYQWIVADLEKNLADPRPESFYIKNHDNIYLGDVIDTEKGTWQTRKKFVLNKVYSDMDMLISESRDKQKCTSLAVFKPSKVLDFVIEPSEKDWDQNILSSLDQLDLFQKYENPFKVVKKLPYKFSYIFEDHNCKEIKMMIEDWEIGQLYWNCLERKESEKLALVDVRKKYYDDFALTKDLLFFIGTTRQYHFIAKNPFIIIGTFHPKYSS
ncbi:MAG: hypothetical protein A2176_08805 [Spirochaetes bacterium RBG_13_51_14]|nr:MAG: hypothetical protein A2176_08805 [Spirochaetes bacterium RBG_13_51_14]